MALSVGDLVGKKYKILKYLGRGGLGDVYLAEDQLLARKVAIKHLRPGSAREQADVQRFLAEARAIARIQHENVVAIYDAIEEKEGNYYLVMEYADEGTVADLLRREGRLPVLRALELVQAIAQALEIVHAQGILHGDIKPSNIVLVSSQGGVKAKLADFGLSQVVTRTAADQATFTGSIMYSAPEQMRGEAVDRRADLYALGAVLYEMLVGQPPFPSMEGPEDVARVIRGKLEGSPALPSVLNSDVSPGVDELVLKALSKTPDERYPDARAFGQALRQAMMTHQAWQERVQAAYARGVEHEQRGEWEQAIACYEAVLVEQPRHPQAQGRLGHAQEQRDWKARYEEGLQAYDRGEWAEAERVLSQVVAHDQGYAGGDAAVKLQEARRQFELAGMYQEARGHEAEERWSEAVSLYLKILTEVSDYEDVSARLADAIEQQKRQTLYNKAREHLANQDWTEAVKTLQELERLKPGYKDSATLLVEARRQRRLDELYTQAAQALNSGEWTSAVEAFSRVVQLEPEYKDAATKRAIAERQQQLASLYEQAIAGMAAEDWTAAAARLQEIREIAPSYRDAEHLLEEALQKRHIADLYQEGVQLCEGEEWEQAIQRLEAVHQLQPGYRDVEQRLGEVQRVQRIQALYAQARQFEVEEEWTEAIRTYSDLIQLDSNHRDAKAGLARVSAASLGRGQPSAVERRERVVAVVASLLVIMAMSCMFLNPLSRMAGAIFPSPMPSWVIAEVTRTPTPPAAILIPTTMAPNPTPTSTPTLPLTDTPTFTPTRTPSPTSTHTPSPMPTPTPPSRVTRTPVPPRYRPPVLGWGGIIACNVTFRWEWPGTLAEDEWFAVRVGKLPDIPHSQTWTKEHEYTCQVCDGGDYTWEVAICRGDPAAAVCEQLAVSQRSDAFSFGGCSCSSPTKPTPEEPIPKPDPGS
jgi:outer membrane protein assembly factor BamD (BamD/ComL family)/tRNA A-37 threonylcarbamoyl transferase component Bud32